MVEVLLALSMLVSVGAGVIISNCNGRGEHKEARRVFNIAVRLLAAMSAAVALGGLVFLEPLVRMLGATPDIMHLVTEYLSYFFRFSPAFVFSYALAAWLRNDGQPRLAMTSQIIGAFSNVFLDWLFMGPFQLGIAGAAIATGLGPVFSILIMLPHFLKSKGNLYFEKVRIDLDVIGNVFKKGIPSFTMEFALGLTTLCVNVAIGFHMGSLHFAAYGIIGYIALMVLSVFLGMAAGSQPLISFYHGAGELRKAKQILTMSLKLAVWIGILSYMLLFLFPEIPVGVFADNDRELVRTATLAARWYFPALFVSGLNILLSSYTQSVGHWKESMVISLSRSLILLVPLLIILPAFLGGIGIWLSAPTAEILTLPVGYLALRKTQSILTEAKPAEMA